MNRLKTYLSISCVWIFSILMSACTDENDVSPASSINTSEAEFSFDKNANETLLYVQSDGTYEMSSDAEWCTITEQETESFRTDVYRISVSENTTVDVRNALITFTANNNAVKTVKVTQSATEFLDLDGENDIPMEGEGGTFSINLQNNGGYDINIDCDWITRVQPTNSKSVTTSVETFMVDRNVTTESRTGKITISLSELTETITITQNFVAENIEDDQTGMDSDAQTLLKKMKIGWNLGNTLEATGAETAWGNPLTTEAMIKKIKELGFNAIRIPCSWDTYLSDETNYQIQASWLRRVKEVVDYCVNNEVYAILNIHWDGGWLENSIPDGYSEEVDAKQEALWTQIAKYFRDYNEYLIFAGCNEPNVEDEDDMATLLRYEQTFIDAVRATGGKNKYRNLIVQGPSTDIYKTCQYMNTMPTDDTTKRMILEVHYYTPWQFCGLEQDESWGKMMYFWGTENQRYATGEYSDRWYENGETELENLFNQLKSHADSKDIPVIIGEFAACIKHELSDPTAQEGHDNSRAYFNECVVREAKERGMVPFYWDAGSGIFNRFTLEISDQIEYNGLMEGAKQNYPN